MTEERWAAHGGIPACDLCHSRKVKCDRKDPCATCTNAKVECLRTRQKRAARPRVRTDDKIRALVEKLSSLEDAVSHQRAVQQPRSTGDSSSIRASAESESTPRPSKRPRINNSGTAQDTLSPPDSITSSQPQRHSNEARDLIEKELSQNGNLAAHQRDIFETAIAFVDQLSQFPPSLAQDNNWDMTASTDLSQGELVQIILANQRREHDSRVQLRTLDHIPPRALEKMAVNLLDGAGDERTLNMYKVIVHFKAALGYYASQLQSSIDPKLREHIKRMQLHHYSAALIALDRINFLTPPSLLLLQALVTGAILTHLVGNSQGCWSLTAYASRTLVALGYHNLQRSAEGAADEEEVEAINSAVAWCYHFDRVMSLLLLRPPSLPPLDTPVSALVKHDPENPMSIFATVMLEMVPIYEKILELTFESPLKRSYELRPSVSHEVEQLHSRLISIYAMMEEARKKHDSDSNQDFTLHWNSLEFKYLYTLTAVLRLSPTVTSNVTEREQCVEAARRALICVKQIQTLGQQRGHFVEQFSPYLSWTILSYPLCPFFVIFCNVVGTSNQRDFQLLQDVVDSISSLQIENKYVERLQRLCSTLLALCEPLVHAPNTAPTTSGTNEAPLNSSLIPSANEERSSLGQIEPLQTSDGLPLLSWDDEKMWQLFQFQPSLDWFNSDLLDPASWDLNLPN